MRNIDVGVHSRAKFRGATRRDFSLFTKTLRGGADIPRRCAGSFVFTNIAGGGRVMRRGGVGEVGGSKATISALDLALNKCWWTFGPLYQLN